MTSKIDEVTDPREPEETQMASLYKLLDAKNKRIEELERVADEMFNALIGFDILSAIMKQNKGEVQSDTFIELKTRSDDAKEVYTQLKESE